MKTYYFIWKYNQDCYIMSNSTEFNTNSYSYVRNDPYIDFNQIEQYYNDHPERRFNGFSGEIAWQNYIDSLSNLRQDMHTLEQWFTMYDQQIQQYNRAMRLNLPYDAKYGTIEELDAQAVVNSQRISELRTEIEELEKNKPQQPR